MSIGSKHLWLIPFCLCAIGNASAQNGENSRLSLSCVSRETNQQNKEPLVSLQTYTSVGIWTDGKWKRANLASITASTPRVSGIGGGALNIGARTYEVATTLSVAGEQPFGEMQFISASKTLAIEVKSLDSLTKQGADLILRSDGKLTAHLTCFSQRGSTAAKAAPSKALPAKERTNQTSSSNSSPSSKSSQKPQHCNSNEPTGIAQCPAGQLNAGPKGVNEDPVVDRSVKKCSVFSDLSVPDANAKAVAEANARAKESLNCWYVVTACYYTPSDKCPPGMNPTGIPPTCSKDLEKGGYFSQTSHDDALKKCEAEAAKIDLCALYKPICITTQKSPTSSKQTSSSPSSPQAQTP